MVYEQWLHADLRDVGTQPCIPSSLVDQQTSTITGHFVVQVYTLILHYAQKNSTVPYIYIHRKFTQWKRLYTTVRSMCVLAKYLTLRQCNVLRSV